MYPRSRVAPVLQIATPLLIVVLPILGFYFERAYGEVFSISFGPALYAIYALGLIAYAALAGGILPRAASWAAAGVLLTGSALSALLSVPGLIVLFFNLLLTQQITWLARAIGLVAIGISPALTAFLLAKVAADALRSSASPSHAKTAWVATGIALAISMMALAQWTDARWLEVQLRAFDTNDRTQWERALAQLEAYPLCGNRRCKNRVCTRIARRSRLSTPGPELAAAFAEVYGAKRWHLCTVILRDMRISVPLSSSR
jgi:hypothetical protein